MALNIPVIWDDSKENMSRSKFAKNKNVIVIILCEKHESYRAVYPPKTDCLICWKIYATRMHSKVKTLKIILKELKSAGR